MEKNILSIDFDYFQDITPEQLFSVYPDPHDFDTKLSTIIWQAYYANAEAEKKLKRIKNNTEKIRFVKKILIKNADSDTKLHPTMAVNSHRHIHDFIKINYGRKDRLHIYNLDTHHDMFHENMDEITCSNWGLKLKETFPGAKITWICNSISEEIYPSKDPDIITKDINIIKNIDFDMIFLCRSDHYVPPHLDKGFKELLQTIQKHYATTWMEQDIEKCRTINDIPQLKQLTAQNQKLQQSTNIQQEKRI